jgi:hypothetical protein
LPTVPASGYSPWVNSGKIDLSAWAGGKYYIGFRYTATQDVTYATWCLDNVQFGVESMNRADLETMGNATTTLGTYTSTGGWVASNCTLLQGSDVDANPLFIFIGCVPYSEEYAMAPTLSGNTNTVGTLVSPLLHGGLNRLRFNYGSAYTASVLSFRVDVKQGGQVVKTWTVTNDDVTRQVAYTFDEYCGVSGDYTVEITNLCPTAATTNKDRVSIWNISMNSAE